jgi:hypothetical protein
MQAYHDAIPKCIIIVSSPTLATPGGIVWPEVSASRESFRKCSHIGVGGRASDVCTYSLLHITQLGSVLCPQAMYSPCVWCLVQDSPTRVLENPISLPRAPTTRL